MAVTSQPNVTGIRLGRWNTGNRVVCSARSVSSSQHPLLYKAVTAAVVVLRNYLENKTNVGAVVRTQGRTYTTISSQKHFLISLVVYSGTKSAVGPAMEINRPKAAKQGSRKGKRAWRKNIDIEDVQKGLEGSREAEILLGKDDVNFIIDTEGDENLLKKAPKKLKSHEILENKSKAKPLITERNNKKIQGVQKKDVHRLMRLTGRVVGDSKLNARVEKDGLLRGSNEDLWGSEPADKSDLMPEILKTKSTTGYTKAKHAPKTMKFEPIKQGESTRDIDAGKSYNPSLESWKQLIQKEFKDEKERELKRQELLEHQEKIRSMISEINEEEESTTSGSESDASEEEDAEYKLSINAPTKVKIKTKSKRNREAKHKEKMKLQEQLRELKEQVKELSNVEKYTEETEQKQVAKKPKKSPKKRKLFKYDPVSTPLEVKLSDELTSNLKDVKPEGNLFYETMKTLQVSGKVETRIPVAKKRRYTPKITEKWTYKDFK